VPSSQPAHAIINAARAVAARRTPRRRVGPLVMPVLLAFENGWGTAWTCEPRRAWVKPRVEGFALDHTGSSVRGPVRTGPRGPPQKASDEMTSEPEREPRAHQTVIEIESLIARTEPSANMTFTTPGCRLLAVGAPLRPPPVPFRQLHVFGGMT